MFYLNEFCLKTEAKKTRKDERKKGKNTIRDNSEKEWNLDRKRWKEKILCDGDT